MSEGAASSGTSTLDVLFAAIEASPEAVGIACAGRVVRVNRAFADLFGYADPAEMHGRPLVSFAPPPDRDYVSRVVAQREAGGAGTATHRTRAIRKDGSVFDLET